LSRIFRDCLQYVAEIIEGNEPIDRLAEVHRFPAQMDRTGIDEHLHSDCSSCAPARSGPSLSVTAICTRDIYYSLSSISEKGDQSKHFNLKQQAGFGKRLRHGYRQYDLLLFPPIYRSEVVKNSLRLFR